MQELCCYCGSLLPSHPTILSEDEIFCTDGCSEKWKNILDEVSDKEDERE